MVYGINGVIFHRRIEDERGSHLTRREFLSLLGSLILFCLSSQLFTTQFKEDENKVKVNIPSFLGGSCRRFYGKGPVPDKLDVVWKIWLGKGKTKVNKQVKTWYGTGWTGQPLLIEENNRLYLIIGAYDWRLRKIDALTGEVLWKYKFDDVIKGSSTVFINPNAITSEERVIILQGSRRGFNNSLYSAVIPSYRAISFKTGRELWRLNIAKTESYSRDVDGSGLILDGLLYLGAENGIFYIIDPTKTVKQDGMIQPKVIKTLKLYTKEDAKRHRGNLVIESSPAVLGNRVYVAAGSGHVYGIDIKTQGVTWDFYIGADLDSTPVITRSGFIIVGVEKQYIRGRGGVFKLDPQKKPQDAVIWYFPTRNVICADWKGGVIGSVSINDDYNLTESKPSLVAFSAIDGYLYLVSQDKLNSYKVYGPDGKKIYSTPRLIWKEKLGPSISTPIIVDDYIIAAGYDNKVNVFKINYYRAGSNDTQAIRNKSGISWKIEVIKIAYFQAQGSFESTPIVWEGKIYIGCRDGYLYCLAG